MPHTFPIRRVALVSDWFSPRLGGIETHLGDLGRALAGLGMEPEVLTTTAGPAVVDGLPVRRIGGARMPVFDVAMSPSLFRRVHDDIRDGGFDLVHIHASIVAPVALAGLLAARRLGLPAVATFHSRLPPGGGLLRWTDAILGWSRRDALFTAVGATLAAQAAAALSRPVSILPNGVDLAAWSERPARTLTDDRPIVIAAAMRLAPRKRPRALIAAFARAQGIAARRGRALELRIAGDGPQRRAMERDARALGVAQSVRLLGALPRSGVRALFADSDVFVLPSIREAFGIAALEARASGLPVLAMQSSGVADFLDADHAAMLARDDHDLAANIARLACDEALRARLSGRDAGLARYDWARVVQDHLDAYARAAALLAR